jgi:predicted GNAT family acetyltransferase
MRRDADSIRRCIEHNRIYITEVDGQVVSAALTNVETKDLAMIGGVFTPEPLRNKGYASAAMSALCTSLISDGRQPCLFYDNPAAGTIYRRLGFAEIGPWRLAFLRHRTSFRPSLL